jgi:septation ring formation regulator EzrA
MGNMGNPPPLKSDDPFSDISRKLEGLLASLNNLDATIKAQSEKIDSLQGLEKSRVSSSQALAEPLVDVNRLAHISHTEGVLQTSLANLDRRTSAQGERIEQLLQWASIVPHLEKDLERTTNDLNQLGRTRMGRLENLAHLIEKVTWFVVTVGAVVLAWYLSGLRHTH